MRIIVESERYNPFITIRASVRKMDGSSFPSVVGHALSARSKALLWTVVAVVELPFLLIGATFKLVLGGLTLMLAAVTRSKDRFNEGVGEFRWIGQNVVGLISTIAIGALSVAVPEITLGNRLRLHTYNEYIFIPWCCKSTSNEIPVDATTYEFEKFKFNRTTAMDVEGREKTTWRVTQVSDPEMDGMSSVKFTQVDLPVKSDQKIECFDSAGHCFFISLQKS